MSSDIVLIFNTFSGTTKFSLRITNLSLYYVGQLLIAGSLFIMRQKMKVGIVRSKIC